MARLLIGIAVALCACGAAMAWEGLFAAPWQAGPARWVAVDRDGARLVFLDEQLYPAGSSAQSFPVRAAVRRAGGCWVVRAVGGHPLGSHELQALDRDGQGVGAAITLEPVLDLAVDSMDGAAVVLAASPSQLLPGGRRELLAVVAPGHVEQLGALRDAACVAAGEGRLLVGGDDGRLHLLERPGAGSAVDVLGRRRLPGQIGDVEPAQGSGWWVLDVARGRVLLIDRDLHTRWEAAAGLSALHLAPVPGEERVWLVDTTEPLALRLGPQGVTELLVQDLPQGGLDRAAARPDGGLVLAAPGALLELDASGVLVRTQGGFHFLVDVARYR